MPAESGKNVNKYSCNIFTIVVICCNLNVSSSIISKELFCWFFFGHFFFRVFERYSSFHQTESFAIAKKWRAKITCSFVNRWWWFCECVYMFNVYVRYAYGSFVFHLSIEFFIYLEYFALNFMSQLCSRI